MIRRATWLVGAPFRWAIMGVILAYRGTLGRLLAGRCRFHPTCSAYALEAVRAHGALKGTVLAAWRVLRCSPLTAGGLDPVPASKNMALSERRMTSSHGLGGMLITSYSPAREAD